MEFDANQYAEQLLRLHQLILANGFGNECIIDLGRRLDEQG